MRRAAVLFAMLSLVPVRAQDPAALGERERALAARAVAGLNEIADALEAEKQHGRAFELRRELLLEYDAEDAHARRECGFVPMGDGWRRDDSLLVLERDLRGNGRTLRKIDRELEQLGRELLKEHRALAAGWAAVPEADRAARHWRRVLRWAPDDRQALAALDQAEFEGFRGTAKQMTMLRRARAIGGAVDWLLRTSFPTTTVQGGVHPLLQASGLSHIGVKSEHFEIWGTLPEPQLVEIAQFAERAFWLTHTLFGTGTGEVFAPVKHRNMLFAHSTAGYEAVLDQCAAQFSRDRMAFLKAEGMDMAFVEHRGAVWRLYRAVKGRDLDLDQTVRAVVQDASGIDTDGLYEGIGHAACGFVFHRTLTFLLEQKTERTSASSSSTLLSPDLETWRKIAETSAWARSDSRTSELVLLSAARFTNEQRVKAWAIGDYLLHWRPEWLLELDRCRTDGVRTPPDVEAEFLRRTGYELPRIDAEWREFWAKERELREVMARDPLERAGKDQAPGLRARSLVDAVDAARVAAGRGPVGFVVADNSDTRAVRDWIEALAKAKARQKRKPKEEVPMPEPPPALGTTVLWSSAKEPADAVAEWLCAPALRDALLHPGRGLCGAAIATDDWVLDVGEPARPTQRGAPVCWPRPDQADVPGAAAVHALGERAAAALAAAGHADGERAGMPLTLHFARAVAAEDLAAVQCDVYDGNLLVDGVLVSYASDGTAREHRDGLVAFVPRQPLPAGHRIEVRWQLPAGLADEASAFPPYAFTVR